MSQEGRIFTHMLVLVSQFERYTVVPVMNGHPRDQAKVSVHCRWPLIRGNLTLKCVGRGIDNVAVQGRWPLTTGVAQGRYYCSFKLSEHWYYVFVSRVGVSARIGQVWMNTRVHVISSMCDTL